MKITTVVTYRTVVSIPHKVFYLTLNGLNIKRSGIPRGEGFWGGSNPPKFLSVEKAEPNSQFRRKYIHNNLIRIQVSLTCTLSGTPD
jgi:hypothetical protein